MSTLTEIKVNAAAIKRLKEAVQSDDYVQGLTHNYYRYPARFSPKFVRTVIDIFSKPGDVILDPFVGGGTTLVEALASNRHSIGFDVSPIAAFVSSVKTTLLTDSDIDDILIWAGFVSTGQINGYIPKITFYDDDGYLNNLPWRIKSSVEVILNEIELLQTEQQKRFAKCVVLKTAQWAIDCRKTFPTAKEFRNKFFENLQIAFNGARELRNLVLKNSNDKIPSCICINSSSELISQSEKCNLLPSKPNLIVTSPPYVGVHMLYHQWQVKSRKRTRAPFWIIDSLDGEGSSFYTFGHYNSHAKKTYFEIAKKVFNSIHSSIADDGIIVQLVGFSNSQKFLPKYLAMMNEAGYEEASIVNDSLGRVRRIWRNVPNRKWYVTTKNEAPSSKEVLLVHRKK